MSLLSYTEICELIEQGVIENSNFNLVNSASLDIRLSNEIMKEHPVEEEFYRTVSLAHRTPLAMEKKSLPYLLLPNEFILGSSFEIFHLPNDISAEYKLKSSMARIGLEHLNAGWCDAGWNNSVLTLELKNMTQRHAIELNYKDKIGQIVFFRHTEVPGQKSYAVRGRYNGDKTVQGMKK
jgi:dCTP deaminase